MIDPSEQEFRARIMAQFQKKWDRKEAERRVTLLSEVIPRIPEYAQLNNARVDIKLHPEHLEFYIAQLQPKVRAIIEHVPARVLDKILDSHTTDEKIAKVVRLVNMMDERMAAAKEAKRAEEGEVEGEVEG
ncbi:MAG: hypothetical protein AB7L09_02735 [Nitrospira sp.]